MKWATRRVSLSLHNRIGASFNSASEEEPAMDAANPTEFYHNPIGYARSGRRRFRDRARRKPSVELSPLSVIASIARAPGALGRGSRFAKTKKQKKKRRTDLGGEGLRDGAPTTRARGVPRPDPCIPR
jgi:hypothetical protein